MQIERLRFSRLVAIVLALVIFGAGMLVGMSFTGRSAIAGTMAAPPLTADQMNMGGSACPMMKGEAAPADKTKVQAEGACPAMKDPAGGEDQASASATHNGTGDACGMKEGASGACPMAKKPAASAAAPAAAKAPVAEYICTMCPDVHASKPGNCPKCGMALVKKAK